MHLNLDEFNLILENKCSEEEQHEYSEHILSCESCRKKFKMLNALKTEMMPEKSGYRTHHFIRYAVGVAAVLFLSAWPYFHKSSNQVQAPQAPRIVQKEEVHPINVLSEIQKVNQRKAFSAWGKESTIQDLIKKS